MRCLECNRLVATAAESCPYCGSNVLTPSTGRADSELAKHARSIWDQTDPQAKVVYLPGMQHALTGLDFLVSVLVWGVCWLGAAILLGVTGHWLTWVGLVIAVTANGVMLELVESPPLWRLLWRRIRTDRALAKADQETTHDVASNM